MSRKSAIQGVLREPGGELAVTIEPMREGYVTDEIVDGPGAVVGATRFVPEERVPTVSVDPSRDDLQEAGGAHGGNHFHSKG